MKLFLAFCLLLPFLSIQAQDSLPTPAALPSGPNKGGLGEEAIRMIKLSGK